MYLHLLYPGTLGPALRLVVCQNPEVVNNICFLCAALFAYSCTDISSILMYDGTTTS